MSLSHLTLGEYTFIRQGLQGLPCVASCEVWPYRLTVRTSPFQGGNRGSIPRRATMKFIGRGWQYTVYDLENGRVLKKYNTRLQGYWIILKQCFPYINYPLWKIPKYYNGCKNTAFDSIRKIKTSTMDMALFGNPKILNDLDYEQDKVIPLSSYFKQLDISRGQQTIDRFIDFNLILIENRLMDKSFLIGKNYGINGGGDIILTDIGELYSSDERIKQQIEKKPWDINYVTSTIPKRFREYFVTEMNRRIVFE